MTPQVFQEQLSERQRSLNWKSNPITENNQLVSGCTSKAGDWVRKKTAICMQFLKLPEETINWIWIAKWQLSTFYLDENIHCILLDRSCFPSKLRVPPVQYSLEHKVIYLHKTKHIPTVFFIPFVTNQASIHSICS